MFGSSNNGNLARLNQADLNETKMVSQGEALLCHFIIYFLSKLSDKIEN